MDRPAALEDASPAEPVARDERAFRAATDALLPGRVRAGALTVAALMLAFAAVDLATDDFDLAFRLVVRVVFTPAYLAIAALATRPRWVRRSQGLALLVGAVTAVELGLLGSTRSPVENIGFFPAMLFFSTYMPVPRQTLFAVVGLFLSAFLAGQLLAGEADHASVLKQAANLAAAGIVAMVAAELAERLRRSEFEANVQLASANRRLRELDRFKSRFFADVSHELRTPLAAALLAVEDAAAKDDPAAAKGALLPLRRLRGLVEELLELTRLDAGLVRPGPETSDLAAVVRALADEMSSAFEARRIELRVTLPEAPARVPVGRAALDRIILNLLGNVLKFAPVGGEVRIVVAVDGGLVSVELRDDGPGIPPELQARIFERYVRLRPDGPERGSGIGLALARELTELHGGTIACRSPVGGGTAFQAAWPLATRADDARASTDGGADPADRIADVIAGALDGTAAADGGAPRPASLADATRPLVLVVEDHVDLAHRIASVLAPVARVALAHDGPAGLEQARALVPDLVVCDLLLPGLDGLALIARLRADPATRQASVLLLTALAEKEQVIQALAAGADDYVLKPFDREILRARVEALLRRKKRREASAGSARVWSAACGTIALALDVETVVVLLPQGGGELEPVASGGTRVPAQSGWGSLAASRLEEVPAGQAVLFSPAQHEATWPALAGAAVGAAAALTRDGKLLGAIVAMDRRSRPLDERALAVLAAAAAYAGEQIGREQVLDELARTRDDKRRLLAAVFSGQDSERRRLARDLHDGTGQTLIGALLHLDLATRLTGEPARAQAERSRVLVDQAIQEIRALSRDLHPPTLAQLGLCDTLRALAAGLTGDAFSATAEVPVRLGREVAPEAAIALYRIAQAALANAARHAQARRVVLHLHEREDGLELEVVDDGIGFVVTDTAAGVGLLSMRERAESLGGTLTIESALGRGARVRAFIPASPEPRAPIALAG